MKYSLAASAVAIALTSQMVLADEHSDKAMERIQVKGTYFNDYKTGDASGANRMDTSLLEVPQTITVIPKTIMDEQLTTTLGEVLTNDASLTAGSKQRNRETFNLRGFSLSSSTGYLRDGHQHWSHYQQPIELLERVEVVKGPSSILYGQSGPGGLVNMVTKKPTYKTRFMLGADVDHRGSTRFLADASGALTDDESLRARTVLVKQDVNFWRDYPNDGDRERDRALGSLVVDYDLTDDTLIRVHYDRTNDKAGLDTGAWLDQNGEVIGSDKTIYDFSWAFTDITVENVGVDIQTQLNNHWRMNLAYNEQTFERQRFESSPRKPDDYVLGDSYASKPYDRHDDWQFKTAFIDFIGEFQALGVDHRLLIGANGLDYYYGQLIERGDTINYTPGDAEPVRPDLSYHRATSMRTSDYDYYGVYIQDLVTFNPQWQLSFGGRYDKQNRENANSESFAPKLGVLYHPTHGATLYASYSEGFEPQRSERLQNELDVNDGMRLDATTSEQVEIGAKWELFDNRLMLSGALFDISKEGTLVSESLPADHPQFGDYETITRQIGEQRHKGAELMAQGAVTDRFFVMASAMYLDANYERDEHLQGKRPSDAPQWSASVWSRYEFNKQFAVNAGVFYEGDRFADSNNEVVKDSYARVDLGATYKMRIANTKVKFRFNVENALDTDYLAGGGMNNVTVGEGANFRLAANVKF
ncbi:TonB-dependent siderophore receptor [Idiomarina piscisalsi]|uniref:TonB-dependent siderophore receptor n=1 Tax=Idiomarina piscisalsi TaxID=1096243 RepID=A0A432YM90_9GAMM|nr:TonB-dependent receptor [Idiomarina piscisalsi]RUO62008.1 TonB-dependent siderophore receptor [Idiomarina piscisalsi]